MFFIIIKRIPFLKNTLLLFFFIFIFSSSMGKGEFFIGMQFGGHYSNAFISNIYSPLSLDKSSLLGYHIALSGKFLTESKTKFQPGVQIDINFIQKGYQQNFTDDGGSFKTQMFYLEIPFMTSLVFHIRKKKEQVFMNAGPYVEFFLFQNNTLTEKAIAEDEKWYPFDPAQDNIWGYGLKGLVGISKMFSFGQIQLDGGASYTLSDFKKTKELSFDIPNNTHHIVYTLSISYYFLIR